MSIKLDPLAKEFFPSDSVQKQVSFEPAVTYWEYNNEITAYDNQYIDIMHNKLEKLKVDAYFCKSFIKFVKDSLRLDNVNCEKGCRLYDKLPKYILMQLDKCEQPRGLCGLIMFWFYYRQNGTTYTFAYESKDYNTPGSFYQWNHSVRCNGYTCDAYNCLTSYCNR